MRSRTQSAGGVVTTREAAEYLGVSERTVRRYLSMGLLAYGRLPGGHYRVSEESLLKVLGGTRRDAGSPTKAAGTRRHPRLNGRGREMDYDLSPDALAALRARHS